MITSAQVSAEVLGLHAFFQDWFRGSIPRTRDRFTRVATVWSPPFTLIDPHNEVHDADQLLTQTYRLHGAFTELRIEIRKIEITVHEDHALATAIYEEWHIDKTEIEGRLCSATLVSRGATAAGLAWLHIHESRVSPMQSAA